MLPGVDGRDKPGHDGSVLWAAVAGVSKTRMAEMMETSRAPGAEGQ